MPFYLMSNDKSIWQAKTSVSSPCIINTLISQKSRCFLVLTLAAMLRIDNANYISFMMLKSHVSIKIAFLSFNSIPVEMDLNKSVYALLQHLYQCNSTQALQGWRALGGFIPRTEVQWRSLSPRPGFLHRAEAPSSQDWNSVRLAQS